MKTHATFRYFLTVTSLAAVLAVQPPSAHADDKRVYGVDAQMFAEFATNGYDFVVSRGMLWLVGDRQKEPANLGAMVDALRKRYSGANIVMAPDLSEVGLPDLKLRASSLTEMLEAIRIASGNKFDWIGPGSPGLNQAAPKTPAIDPSTGLPVAGASPQSDDGLFVLREPMRTSENERVVEAFNITPYIATKMFEARRSAMLAGTQSALPAEDERLASAKLGFELSGQIQSLIIETVASFRQVDKSVVNLKFEYHAGANLLIVIGSREDVAVARKVVNALITDSGAGEKGGGWEKFTADAEPLSMEAIPIKYAKLDKAYAAAMSLLEDKRSKVVVVDERTKTLLVTATKAELSAIRKAVEQLELASKPYVGDGPPARASVPAN